jgi:hypothetical protein
LKKQVPFQIELKKIHLTIKKLQSDKIKKSNQ